MGGFSVIGNHGNSPMLQRLSDEMGSLMWSRSDHWADTDRHKCTEHGHGYQGDTHMGNTGDQIDVVVCRFTSLMVVA